MGDDAAPPGTDGLSSLCCGARAGGLSSAPAGLAGGGAGGGGGRGDGAEGDSRRYKVFAGPLATSERTCRSDASKRASQRRVGANRWLAGGSTPAVVKRPEYSRLPAASKRTRMSADAVEPSGCARNGSKAYRATKRSTKATRSGQPGTDRTSSVQVEGDWALARAAATQTPTAIAHPPHRTQSLICGHSAPCQPGCTAPVKRRTRCPPRRQSPCCGATARHRCRARCGSRSAPTVGCPAGSPP